MASLPFSSLQPGDIFKHNERVYLKLVPVCWSSPTSYPAYADAIQIGHWSLARMGDIQVEKIGHQELIIRDGAVQPESWLELESLAEEQDEVIQLGLEIGLDSMPASQ